jgi:3-deoxy-manno-octulosonate cytidylyltransferase (CMP-KDO synthetase)
MLPDFVVAIPARFAATRLPGKPLRLLGGEPLVLHVARRALAAGAREVWVAADDVRIADALADCGVHVAMTSTQHASGSDRLAECATIAGWSDDTVIVNLQGDEPFAPAEGLRAAANALEQSGAEMSTLATQIVDAAQLFDPNTVKLVRADNGDALYFSRAPIPWHRDAFSVDRERLPSPSPWLRHIGLYAYRAGFLKRFAAMPPGRMEQVESLEQLRALEAGFRIRVEMTSVDFPAGVDTEHDLEIAERHLRALNA